MTREEAIKALIKERKTALHENKHAFDMAIKALKQDQYYKDLAESYEKTINKLTKAIAEQDK